VTWCASPPDRAQRRDGARFTIPTRQDRTTNDGMTSGSWVHPELVTGVWMGFDKENGDQVDAQGGKLAAPA